ncbi:MAG: hypothetical protein EpisKO_06080 [Epibacterium sp.]
MSHIDKIETTEHPSQDEWAIISLLLAQVGAALADAIIECEERLFAAALAKFDAEQERRFISALDEGSKPNPPIHLTHAVAALEE